MPIFSHHWIQSEEHGPPRRALQLRGPALQVQIAVPDEVAAILDREEKPIPSPQTHTALIDTGASFTAVEEHILLSLGLHQVSSSQVSTPQGHGIQGVYACKISFPGTPIPSLSLNAVLGCKLEGFGHVALIGRDILSQFLLVYNGVEGNWPLAF